jgi:hypothetical protein
MSYNIESPTAQCACLKVQTYLPLERGPDSHRDRWLCQDCGTEFVKKVVQDYAFDRERFRWDCAARVLAGYRANPYYSRMFSGPASFNAVVDATELIAELERTAGQRDA